MNNHEVSNKLLKKWPTLILMMITVALLYIFSPFSYANEAKTTTTTNGQYAKAVLAGGCFWCTEADMEKVDGVIDVVSGYAGGTTKNPTYEDVSSGSTGHLEVIEVTYDPSILSYEAMLDEFMRGIDPTDSEGSFVDRGKHYRPAIFYQTEQEKAEAMRFINEIDAAKIFPQPLKIEFIKLDTFYVAEDYHQDYYINNPLRYRYYRHGSGRDQYLDSVFGADRKTNPKTLRQLIDEKKGTEPNANNTNNSNNGSVNNNPDTAPITGNEVTYKRPSDEEIKAMLNDIEYKVTQQDGTERPFDNRYWDHKEEGIYVDIVSGEPLFSSTDKYDSGTGWPSFTKPIDDNFIVEKEDNSFFMKRTEVRSKFGDSHLGHVFDDGPAPTGLRYCMNSASMRFIPKAELEAKGYGKYLSLFDKA